MHTEKWQESSKWVFSELHCIVPHLCCLSPLLLMCLVLSSFTCKSNEGWASFFRRWRRNLLEGGLTRLDYILAWVLISFWLTVIQCQELSSVLFAHSICLVCFAFLASSQKNCLPVCMSICPHETTYCPLDGWILRQFISWSFTTVCQHNLVFIKSREK